MATGPLTRPGHSPADIFFFSARDGRPDGPDAQGALGGQLRSSLGSVGGAPAGTSAGRPSSTAVLTDECAILAARAAIQSGPAQPADQQDGEQLDMVRGGLGSLAR